MQSKLEGKHILLEEFKKKDIGSPSSPTRASSQMNRPVFIKSFRSRKSKEINLTNKSLNELIDKRSKIILDIGFGTGDSSIKHLKKCIKIIQSGYRSIQPGIQRLESEGIAAQYGDALEILESLDNNSISQIYMLFPDPWQKSKHRKRRLFNDLHFEIIKKILVQGGNFQFTTDNINYAFNAKNINKKHAQKNKIFKITWIKANN